MEYHLFLLYIHLFKINLNLELIYSIYESGTFSYNETESIEIESI